MGSTLTGGKQPAEFHVKKSEIPQYVNVLSCYKLQGWQYFLQIFFHFLFLARGEIDEGANSIHLLSVVAIFLLLNFDLISFSNCDTDIYFQIPVHQCLSSLL